MKTFFLSFVLLLGMGVGNLAHGLPGDERSPESRLNNVDAFQAVTIANERRWTNPDIKSYVNSRDVVFHFPYGSIKKIPLPADKMLVALAPYIHKTHT